ncbi:unnamed protein product [Tilletia laevis]|uniref:Beta-mannosidase A n=2 Tax=Tilletia TaxID=13289 RepID=A0A9N8Q8M3_9BASI|nr:unnamed protein product [Tilletia caries]CAD6903327.1 unnamed protein product [Tilletia laevis]CAD6913808.1 unnamed protein product [Tilletia laevis]CAD6913965.1 unnamed protein product [Tilletia caries]CAD6964166.1 unnamed protein product [Tilletia caries]
MVRLDRLAALVGSMCAVTAAAVVPSGLQSRAAACAQPSSYIAGEPNWHDPDSGIFGIGTTSTHEQSLPLPEQNARTGPRGSRLPGSSAKVSTSGLTWTLTNSNQSIKVPAKFPSVVHLDLLTAGIIDDPNIGLNEGSTRWIWKDDWTYSSDIKPLLPQLTAYNSTWLYFGALDAPANVSLGGKPIAATFNAFHDWRFDVSSIISAIANGSNTDSTLRILFPSAPAYAAEESKKIPFIPNQKTQPFPSVTTVYEIPNREFVRKTQSDFAWDWGPAYSPSGPLKPAYFVGLDPVSKTATQSSCSLVGKTSSVFVYETSIDIHRHGSVNNLPPNQKADWIVQITLSAVSTIDQKATLQVEFPELPGTLQNVTLSSGFFSPTFKKGDDRVVTASFKVPANQPELWWPIKYGNPKTYDLQLTLRDSTGSSTTWTRKTGFRTVVVSQADISRAERAKGVAPGQKFEFQVNGKVIYAEAINMIPLDVFTPRVSVDRYTYLIEGALAVGQNMIRVWGGGHYQTTQFYDLADQYGILVWSEFIFAASCGYPTYNSFLDNVVEEVGSLVRRKNRHPAQATWVGNSEGCVFGLIRASNLRGQIAEQRLGFWLLIHYIPSASPSHLPHSELLSIFAPLQNVFNASYYFDGYDKLFHRKIRDEVLSNTKAISYVPSSSTTGYFSLNPYIPRLNQSSPGDIIGGTESYGYNMSQIFDVDQLYTLRLGRFAVEFGFHALPSIYSFDRILPTLDDYEFNSTVVRQHNKHNPAGSLEYPFPADDGQGQMSQGVNLYLPTPNKDSDRRANLDAWSYATQILQYLDVAVEMLFFRSRSGAEETNRGIMPWQMNDVWEGSTWSAIEFTGRWRPLQYAFAKCQDRLVAYPQWQSSKQTLSLFAISDFDTEVQGTATWTWYDFAGKPLAPTQNASFTIQPLNATVFFSATNLSNIFPAGADSNNAWLKVNVKSADGGYGNEQIWTLPGALVRAPLQNPGLSLTSAGSDTFTLTAKGPGTAAYAFLEHPEGVLGWWEDAGESVAPKANRPTNVLFLNPGESRTLRFVVKFDRTGGDWRKDVRVRSLWDITH